jgi:hypothetical protein
MSACGSGALAQSPPQPLTPPAAAALGEALADERHALSTYEAAMARFGPIRPFVNIARAEARHIEALTTLYRHYGAPMPPPAAAVDPAGLPATPAEVCALAVEAEIANVALYDKRLLPAAAAYPDIVAVMSRLRDASRDNHLPAFRRCAGRAGAR